MHLGALWIFDVDAYNVIVRLDTKKSRRISLFSKVLKGEHPSDHFLNTE